MKIIHISHLYHPSEGGVQSWFKNVSERLVNTYGDEVTVVTTNSMYGPERKLFKKIELQEELINGVQVKRFSFRRSHIFWMNIFFRICKRLSIAVPDALRQFAYGPISPAMKDYLKSTHADVVCAGSSNYSYMKLPLWKRFNFFYFGSIHIPADDNKPVITDTQLKCINASKLYIANTHFERRRLEKSGVGKDKILVLGVGVDLVFFKNGEQLGPAVRDDLNIPVDSVLIGYAGRIEKTKNVLLLIKSFEALAATHPKIHLLIAGSGNDYVMDLQEFCEALPSEIKNRIKWKVNFSIEEKPAIFNAIDILVLPSNNESFGIVFLEAWACRKPVIGAAIGAVKDVINDEVDGLLMEMDSEESLTQKLELLIEDKFLRSELGANGYKKVAENYTWDIITERLRNSYLASIQQNTRTSKNRLVNV